MFEKDCDNEEEHSFHEYEVNLVKQCDGRSACGAWTHTAHEYEIKARAWCRGVCLCGLYRQKHGPGAHK